MLRKGWQHPFSFYCRFNGSESFHLSTKTMTAFAIAFSWKLLLPLLVVVALLDLLTASDQRKVNLLRKQGMSQRAIAGRLGISRHAVAKLCKAL
jgi:hypothetical protein